MVETGHFAVGGNTIQETIALSDRFWKGTKPEKARLMRRGVALTDKRLTQIQEFLKGSGGHEYAPVLEAIATFQSLAFLNEVAQACILKGSDLIKEGKFVSYKTLLGSDSYKEVVAGLRQDIKRAGSYKGLLRGVLALCEAKKSSSAVKALKKLELEAVKTYQAGLPTILVFGESYFSDPKESAKKLIREPEVYLGVGCANPRMKEWVEDARALYLQRYPKEKIAKWGTMVMTFVAAAGVAAGAPATGQSLETCGLVMFENLLKTHKQTAEAFNNFGRDVPSDWQKYALVLYLLHEFEHNAYHLAPKIAKKPIYEEVAADLVAVANLVQLVQEHTAYQDFDLEHLVISMWVEYNQYAKATWVPQQNENGYTLSGRIIMQLLDKSGLIEHGQSKRVQLSRVPAFLATLEQTYQTLVTNPIRILSMTDYGR